MKTTKATNNPNIKKTSVLKLRLTMLATLLALTTASITSRAAAIAHWTFDELSGPVAHDSFGSFNGTLSANGSTFVSGGISGNAISVDRALNGFVTMGNVLGFTTQPFSLVAWLKTPVNYSINDSVLISKHIAFEQSGYWLEVNIAGGGGQVGKAIFGEGTAAKSVTSTTTVNDGNWHQIVSTFRPGLSLSIFVDGAPVESVFPASPALFANNGAFIIGGVNEGPVPGGRITGLIDEVQIYDHALSESEVDFLFHNPSQVVPEPSTAALALFGAVLLLALRSNQHQRQFAAS